MDERRFPKRVYTHGEEPDPRFSLANERTFLAWISVSLALVSVGVGLESLALNLNAELRLAASIVLVLAGIACSVEAWFGWTRVEVALREHRPLPSNPLLVALPIALVLAGVLVLAALVLK